jgi:hypothetical protein
MDGTFGKYLRRAIRNPKRTIGYLGNNPRAPWVGCAAAIGSRVPYGVNILDFDWDLLVILDTCRADALRQQIEYIADFNINSFNTVWSRGGTTLEWAAQTFTPKKYQKMRDLTYIAGNPMVEYVLNKRRRPEETNGVAWAPTKWDHLSTDDFLEYIPVWKHRPVEQQGTLDDRAHPPASVVTDTAIETLRNSSDNKAIVHYMQPHEPYYASAEAEGREELYRYEKAPFEYLKSTGDRESPWNAYLKCLNSVLKEVNVLLDNVNAEQVVITSDHGDAFGEWRGFGHRVSTINPKIRRVPWIETSASDQQTRHPEPNNQDDYNPDDMLDALGYR